MANAFWLKALSGWKRRCQTLFFCFFVFFKAHALVLLLFIMLERLFFLLVFHDLIKAETVCEDSIMYKHTVHPSTLSWVAFPSPGRSSLEEPLSPRAPPLVMITSSPSGERCSGHQRGVWEKEEATRAQLPTRVCVQGLNTRVSTARAETSRTGGANVFFRTRQKTSVVTLPEVKWFRRQANVPCVFQERKM